MSEPTDSARQPPEARLLLRADVSATAVATLVVEVTAPDLAPALLFNIPIVAGAAAGTITLPAGSNRTIAIRAYDAGGVQTHSGSVTLSIQPGANPTIAIVLTPLTGDGPIEATLGSFGVIVTPAVDSLLIGDTVSLTATILDATGTPVPGQVVWGVLSPRVASVVSTGAQTGRVTAVRPGRTTVVATFGGTAGPVAIAVLGWFAAPTGSNDGDGSGRPWDLQTALAGGNGKVQPGDTVWVRGGTYRGSFPSTLSGTAAAPIVVRAYPGERAILDAGTASDNALTVLGSYSFFWGLELLNSDPNRILPDSGSGFRLDLVTNNGTHNKYINLIMHDGGSGLYTNPDRPDVEVYGCIVYNNGWQGPDRSHGHALYVKNDVGPVVLRDNILFNQFGYGIHVYTDAGAGGLTNIHIEGNVSFNNGAVNADPVNSLNANILFGGNEPVRNGTLVDNMTYFSPNVGERNLLIGFDTTANEDLTVRNNYAVGGKRLLHVRRWQSLTMTDNSLFGSTSDMIRLRDSTVAGFQFANNRYYRDPTALAWGYGDTDYSFAGWQQISGVGATDRAVTSDPAEPRVFLRPNRYEPGRANLIIYNWSRQAAVPVDLSGIVRVGDPYEVRNVQDFFGAAVLSGTYGGGPVDVPMTGVSPVGPIGGSPTAPPQTGPDFGVFVVTSVRQ